MTRNTHDIVNDHFGTLEAEQIATGTPTSGFLPVAAGSGTPPAWTNTGVTTNTLSWKTSVRCATTAAGTLATSFENGDTVDGVTLATGDRLLIKDQAAGAENGIYTVNASGAPTRTADFDAGTEARGAVVFVEEGTANADTIWFLVTNAPITIGSTSLTFTEFSGGSGDLIEAGATSTQVRFVSPRRVLYDSNDEAYLDLNGDIDQAAYTGNRWSAGVNNGDPATDSSSWHTLYGGSGLKFPELSADPTTPFENLTYYNTTTKMLRTWDGTAWQDLWGSGGGAYAETIGDNSATSFPVVHDLGTTDVVVVLWDLTGTDPLLATGDADTIEATDADTVTVTFSAAPATDAYRVVVSAGGGGGGGGGTDDPLVLAQSRIAALTMFR